MNPAIKFIGVKLAVMVVFVSQFTALPGLTARADTPTVNKVAKSVEENYQRYRAIPNLSVKFNMKYEHIAGTRLFAFDSLQVDTKRQSEKLKLHIKAEIAGTLVIDRAYAWNGNTATGIEMLSSDLTAGDFTMSQSKDNNLLYYNYFVDFLNYEDATGSVPVVAGQNATKTARWLPTSLTNDLAKYQIQSSSVGSEGVDCVVLDFPGHETFWFDPAKSYALRRHDVFDVATKVLRTRSTLSEFNNVGGIWLPKLIIREDYGGMDDPETVAGELRSRKTLQVDDFDTTHIPEEEFVLPAPIGIKVHDVGRKVFYTRFKSGENPLIASGEIAKQKIARSGASWIMIGTTGGLFLVIVWLISLIYRAKATR